MNGCIDGIDGGVIGHDWDRPFGNQTWFVGKSNHPKYEESGVCKSLYIYKYVYVYVFDIYIYIYLFIYVTVLKTNQGILGCVCYITNRILAGEAVA